MNPYSSPEQSSDLYPKSKISFPANWVAGICALIFALSCLSSNGETIALVFWSLLAYLIYRFPRQLGIVIAIFMIAAIWIHYYSTESMVQILSEAKLIEAYLIPDTVRLIWRSFLITVLPLIIGAPFAIASTWAYHRKKPKKSEQNIELRF